MAQAILDLRETMRRVELRVSLKHVRQTKIRLWLGAQIFKLAGAVVGCDLTIDKGES